MESYHRLAIDRPEALIFGRSPRPLKLPNGLTIGDGVFYPEINFTLPAMTIDAETMPDVRAQYAQMIDGVCARAVDLSVPGLVVEFELLPELTQTPEWGAAITAILRQTLDRYAQAYGLQSALRVTPNDIREFERPPRMRSGPLWEQMVQSFQQCAQAGADLLSIESTGGKEIHDEALLFADLPAATFALGVLGSRDMAYLWEMIVGVAARTHVIAAGDTACGFGNTAMVLAESRYIPRIWAALIRIMTVPRSLVAYECGARGPSKDCAYEGPYLKAITGYPISLEGAEAACAHASPIGNIARAAADLWSNESVQHIKLLGGMAPTVSLEQLAYSARLMNTAAIHGPQAALMLRDWLVESDAPYDPQAYVLRPDVVIDLAAEIIQEPTAYRRTRRAALAGLERLRRAHAEGRFRLPPAETAWLSRLSAQADRLPEDESVFIEQMMQTVDAEKVRLDAYLSPESAV
jgi:methanol--5-hydroxybenzimidazolylcobamide Co-methyltransferase